MNELLTHSEHTCNLLSDLGEADTSSFLKQHLKRIREWTQQLQTVNKRHTVLGWVRPWMRASGRLF